MGLEEGSALFFKSEIFQLVVEKQVLLDDKIGEAFQKLCLGKPPEYPRFPTVLLLVALQHVPSSSLLAIGISSVSGIIVLLNTKHWIKICWIPFSTDWSFWPF